MLLAYNSGVYLLELLLEKRGRIKIGKKGIFLFPAGFYYYAGSAQKNMKSRLARHKRKVKKKHWHIDYLLDRANLLNVYTWPMPRAGECRLSAYLREDLTGIVISPGFGASDCSCPSHLLYFNRRVEEKELPGRDYWSDKGYDGE